MGLGRKGQWITSGKTKTRENIYFKNNECNSEGDKHRVQNIHQEIKQQKMISFFSLKANKKI